VSVCVYTCVIIAPFLVVLLCTATWLRNWFLIIIIVIIMASIFGAAVVVVVVLLK